MKALVRVPGLLHTIYKANRRRPMPPRFLTYIVTFACNARCIMCDSWKMSAKGDLTLEEIERIFDQLPRMDAVRLTGGEPFARNDLIDIARLAQRKLRPLFLHITTNGFLTERILEFCDHREKSTPLNLLVSIDGVGEKHNRTRGKDTAWESAIRTVREVAARRRHFNVTVAINQTIVDSDGIEHYRLLRHELEGTCVHHHMVMAYDMSATYSLERGKEIAPKEIGEFTTFGEFTEEQLTELFAEVEGDLYKLPPAERAAKRYYLRGIRNRLLGGRGRPNPKCVALNAHMRLFPNGDVPTCQFNSKTAGNLRHQSFEEVWYGSRIEEQREWVHRCPGCWAECEVIPNAIYTGDLLKESLLPSGKTANGSGRDKR